MEDPMKVRWLAQPDDMIGGWCCTFPESDTRTPSHGARQIADFVGQAAAEHVADLHNGWVDSQSNYDSSWMLDCPKCGEEFDSRDSYGDTRDMIRAHIEHKHPTEIVKF